MQKWQTELQAMDFLITRQTAPPWRCSDRCGQQRRALLNHYYSRIEFQRCMNSTCAHGVCKARAMGQGIWAISVPAAAGMRRARSTKLFCCLRSAALRIIINSGLWTCEWFIRWFLATWYRIIPPGNLWHSALSLQLRALISYACAHKKTLLE